MNDIRAKQSYNQFSAKTVILFVCLTLTSPFLSPYKLQAEPQESSQRLENLANEIIELRQEVEELQDKLEAQKETYRSGMQSLNLRKADLSATVQREQVDLSLIKGRIENLKVELAAKLDSDEGIEAILSTGFQDLKSYIENSLPFKKNERLKATADLEKKLSEKNSSPYRLANQLWSIYEDEIRLHRDIGLYKQVVTIDGNEQLVEIAKIGMITYYYKTPEQSYGQLKRDQDSWQQIKITDSEQERQVENLFQTLQKQIRSGKFELPNII